MTRDRPATPLESLLQLQALQHLPRTGWCQHGVPDPESVAEHSFGTALLVLALAPRIEPPLDTGRAVALALLHDAAEAWTGDLPRGVSELLPPGAKRAAEERVLAELLAPLPAQLRERAAEAQGDDSREARLVHACDRLQLGLRLLGYLRAGQRGLGSFRDSLAEALGDEFAPCEALRRELLAAVDALLGESEGRR